MIYVVMYWVPSDVKIRSLTVLVYNNRKKNL